MNHPPLTGVAAPRSKAQARILDDGDVDRLLGNAPEPEREDDTPEDEEGTP